MAGAGDEIVAAGGYFLASDADRRRVVDTLRAAYAEGRLTEAEFGSRVAQTAGSRTYAQLATLTADIPVGPAGAWPGEACPDATGPLPPIGSASPDFEQARLPANIRTTLWSVSVFAALPTVLFGVAYLLDSEKMAALALGLFLIDFLFAVMTGTVALATRIDSRLKNRRYPAGPDGGAGRS